MRASPPRKAVRRAAAAMLLVALTGCKRRPADRTWASCRCEYLTDRDLPGKIGFEVCSEEASRGAVAQSCALGAGMGVVLGCTCDAHGNAACSDRDRCRDIPER